MSISDFLVERKAQEILHTENLKISYKYRTKE